MIPRRTLLLSLLRLSRIRHCHSPGSNRDAGYARHARQWHAGGHHPQRAGACGYRRSELPGGRRRNPAGFPGMAHAQEHMAFRGCPGMTADQTAAIYAQLGGENNADTQQNITQYFATVPAADLDVALEAQAACMHGIDDSQRGVGAGTRRDRAGSGARSLQPDLQVHRPAQPGSCLPARRTRTIRWARRVLSTRPPAPC